MGVITDLRGPHETKRAFAARLGISPPSLSDLERREREGAITVSTLQSYAAALGYEVEISTRPVTRTLPSQALAEHREELRALLSAAGALSVVVFGSTARGQDTPESDLDLLVEFPEHAYPDVAALSSAAGDLLGVPVDIVEREWVSPATRAALEAEGVPL